MKNDASNGGHGADTARTTLKASAPPTAAGTPAPVNLPADLRTHPESTMSWRWRYVATLSGERARHSHYFATLDEATEPSVILKHPAIPAAERGARLKAMGDVSDVLLQRLHQRAQGHTKGPLFRPASEELEAVREAAKTWSRIQCDIVRAYYGTAGHGLDLDGLEWAYLMFVAGELRVPLAGRRGIGEADSGYYFAFAEFALLASDLKIDAQVWDALLPILVWTQAVYVHMQRPMGPKPHQFHQFGPRGSERVFTLSVAADARAKLREGVGHESCARLHMQNCREAFGDLSR